MPTCELSDVWHSIYQLFSHACHLGQAAVGKLDYNGKNDISSDTPSLLCTIPSFDSHCIRRCRCYYVFKNLYTQCKLMTRWHDTVTTCWCAKQLNTEAFRTMYYTFWHKDYWQKPLEKNTAAKIRTIHRIFIDSRTAGVVRRKNVFSLR